MADRPRRAASAVLVVGLLLPVHVMFAAVLAMYARDIANSLGSSTTAVAFALLLYGAATCASAAAHARIGGHGLGHPQAVLGVAGLALLAFVPSTGLLVVLAVLAGSAAGAVPARHAMAVWNRTPDPDRVGALATLAAAGAAAFVVVGQAPVLADEQLTWRGTTLTMAGLGLILVVISVVQSRRLWDNPEAGASALTSNDELRRATSSPVVRRALALSMVVGLALVPATHLGLDLVEWTWGQQGLARPTAIAGAWAVAVIVLVGLGQAAQRRAEAGMERVIGLGPAVAAVAVVAWLVAWSPGHRLAAVAAIGVGMAGLVGLLVLAAGAALHARGPARGWVPTLLVTALVLAGGPVGLFVLGGVQRRFGTAATVGSLAVVGFVALLQARSLVREVAALDAQGDQPTAAPPSHLLTCQGIDFSYGQLQVLFDVDFTVDDGEIVALLGTNGAGKSTLLKVISGLELPGRGAIHFAGEDITFVGAERRVTMGISQIPGGKAVFDPLTVVDNLRVFGHTIGRDRRALNAGLDATFDAFPRLGERRNLPAGVLSGGEQQMLALGKVLLLKPRLLLIDELSLGLAPVIVAELLEMVRRINAGGTAVVLVEQSVNIALSLVDHAYFMERGRIGFDGPAHELLDRGDLVRSVFLQGAAAAAGTERELIGKGSG